MTKSASALTGVARLLAKRSVPVLMILVTAGVLLSLSACSKDGNSVTFPGPPAPESREWFFDVYGTAANDVYVGGALGLMYHYDGTTWQAQDMKSSAAITTIWSSPESSTLYAVGHGGHIWRKDGGNWSSMSSGTSENLYGIGEIMVGTSSADVRIQAVGANGTIRQLNGSNWGGVADVMVILDENNAPIDTLSVARDLSSVLTVNYYFLGGAYFDPDFEGTRFGVYGTKGNILAFNTLPDSVTTADWILRPLSGEQQVTEEWVLCTTSDAATLERNYLGTSEGWLFRLTINDDGVRVWQKSYPEFTGDPGAGIRDLWVDADGNVYVVTDEGKVFYQSFDYDFAQGLGERQLLYDGASSLVSIWGTGPDNLYMTGYYDRVIFHASHDVASGTMTVETIQLIPDPDSNAKAVSDGNWEPGLDEIGRPLLR